MKARDMHFPTVIDRGTLGLRRPTNKKQTAVQLLNFLIAAALTPPFRFASSIAPVSGNRKASTRA
jgi:hypothetical protein